MALKQPQPEVKAGAPDWIVTFADLMSLLMTFFVLLLSFSSMEVEKFNTLAGAIRSSFGLRSPVDLADKPSSPKIIPALTPSDNALETSNRDQLMMVKMRRMLESAGMTDEGEVRLSERGVVLELAGDALFDTGSAALKPEAFVALDKIAETLKSSPRELEVHGHTDDVPIASSRYPSNWELSSARAGSAVRYLTGRGASPNRIKAIGFADSRPLVANENAESRTKNRRVEFLFLDPPGETNKP